MRLFPVAADGWRFIIPLTAIGVCLLKFVDSNAGVVFGVLSLLAAAFCVFFFRDFDRNTAIDENLIYAPGDGKVLEVVSITEGPYQGKQLIRIFLSVLDGHVQRSPVQGRITGVKYQKGLFLDARDPQAHVKNEQNEVTIESKGGPVVVTQIAGLIARRIVCWFKQGDTLGQGQRYGLIRFGSQVDIVLPAKAQIAVKAGDRTVSGLTVIGRWGQRG